MMPDLFHESKCIHIKMRKDTHTALRMLLFKHGISIQEILNEFASQLVLGSNSSRRIMESAAHRKLRETLESTASPRSKQQTSFGELDSDTLYSLINNGMPLHEDNESDADDWPS